MVEVVVEVPEAAFRVSTTRAGRGALSSITSALRLAPHPRLGLAGVLRQGAPDKGVEEGAAVLFYRVPRLLQSRRERTRLWTATPASDQDLL